MTGTAVATDQARAADTLPELVTVQDLARRLRVGRSTVYAWHAEGRLPAYRLGEGHGGLRFSLADVQAFLEARREP